LTSTLTVLSTAACRTLLGISMVGLLSIREVG
jgi:hypothetical protein